MNIIQSSLLLSVLLLSTVSVAVANAQDSINKVDEAALKQRVESIIANEPGAKEAKVEVKVEAVDKPEGRSIDLTSFDKDGDGLLSQDEVGEKLFNIFDRDGNMVIDNIEMEKPSLIVFVPMKRETIETVDYFNGKETKKEVSVDEFLYSSGLGRFDDDKDGLSPLDFLKMPFNKVNVKRDTVIDLYEWKRAYAASVKPLHEENFFYNQ